MPLISVVSPVYQAEKILDELVNRIESAVCLITQDYEIILVEDCSKDDSWAKIKKRCAINTKLKGVKLSRNFGQHNAITAGLSFAQGEWIVVMDCDLQDNPDEIIRLYSKALEGYEVVLAKRTKRKDAFYRLILSDINHFVFSFLSGIKTDRSLSNYGIYKKNVIDEVLAMKEQTRTFSMLINYLGFEKYELEVTHSKRYEGKSSYSFFKLFRHGIDTILSYSNKPLILSITLGFLISFFSFSIAIYNLVAYSMGLVGVPGFTTTVFSIWFSTGITILNLGIIGAYVGKIFNEVKGRPVFIVRKTLNIDADE